MKSNSGFKRRMLKENRRRLKLRGLKLRSKKERRKRLKKHLRRL